MTLTLTLCSNPPPSVSDTVRGHLLCPGLGAHHPPHKNGELGILHALYLKHLPSTKPSLQSDQAPPSHPRGSRGPSLPLARGACSVTPVTVMPLFGPIPQTHLPLPGLLFSPHLGTDLPPALFVLETPLVWEGSVWGGEGFPFPAQGCGWGRVGWGRQPWGRGDVLSTVESRVGLWSDLI